MIEPARADNPVPRAFLRVGGIPLVRHQLALALAAGCERIIAMARGFGPDLAQLQRECEQTGASFHVIGGIRGLSALVAAADEVLVIGEGLLPAIDDALRLLDEGSGVLVQPAETGIPAGFERIDLNHAAAGLMLVPGRLVDRLMELPDDFDPAAALLRIALQAGVAQRPVPDQVRASGRWLLIRTEDEAQAAESAWMVRHTGTCAATPGPLLARLLVRRIGPAVLHSGSSSLLAPFLASLGLAAAGLVLAWLGLSATALVAIGGAGVLQSTAASLDRLRREALLTHTGSAWRGAGGGIAVDLALVAILTVAVPPLPGEILLQRCFAPAVLMALVRLLPRAFAGNWTMWIADRLLLCLLLALMAAGQVIAAGLPGLCLLLLVAALALSGRTGGRNAGAG